MTIVVHKDFEAEGFAGRDLAELPVKYWVKGTDDYIEARAELIAQADRVYDGLVADKWHVIRVGPQTFEGMVIYVAPPVDEWEFNFEIATEQVLFTQALQNVGNYAPTGQTAPDFKGSIGVTRDGIQGTQVPISTYAWSETHYFDRGFVDDSYRAALAGLAGRMNAATFRRFPRGEVIFDGATGALSRSSPQWQVNFKFRQSANATNLVIGNITVASKLGWDYLWVHYVEFPDLSAGRLVKIPGSAHVDRVINFGNFDAMRLPP